MYVPKNFSGDRQAALRIMRQYPLATIVVVDEQTNIIANHLPLLANEKADGELQLLGHCARSNPLWNLFLRGLPTTVIFRGPDAYIRPSWYVSGRDVPTWNYAVTHCRVQTSLIEEPSALIALLKTQSDFFEQSFADPWDFGLPPDLADPIVLTKAIVGFSLTVEHLETKLKLSQNRSIADREGVLRGLEAQANPRSHEILHWMRLGEASKD